MGVVIGTETIFLKQRTVEIVKIHKHLSIVEYSITEWKNLTSHQNCSGLLSSMRHTEREEYWWSSPATACSAIVFIAKQRQVNQSLET